MGIRIKTRIFFLALFFLIIGFLLYNGIVPTGRKAYSYDFKRESPFISKLKPSSRVGEISNGSQRIFGDPVYFSLHTPRKFDRAKMGIYYRSDKLVQAVIESGVMVDGKLWRYDLKLVENKIIDKYCSQWDAIRENGLLLCQRNKRFGSISEFLSADIDRGKIASYDYKLNKEYVIADYAGSDKTQTIDTALQGAYQFYAYIKDEKLDFRFSFIDINKNKDKDPIDLNVYYNDALIDTRHLDDDGNSTDNNMASGIRGLELAIGNLPEGVYKIELRANDDIVTEKIETEQSKVAFINKLHFAKEGNNDIKVYTDSNRIEAITTNPDRLQTLKIGLTDLKIEETYKQFSVKLPADRSLSREVVIPEDGLTVSGNGVFSFKREALFDPSVKKVDENLNGDDIDYIIAEYKMPAMRGGWKYAEVDIDLQKAYRENRNYGFMISVPGLRADDGIDDYLEMGRISFDLEGKNIFQLIGEKFKRR